MSQYDGRGKYLAVPVTSLATSSAEVTQITDLTSTCDTLVIANDYRGSCSQYKEVSFRDDDVTIDDTTIVCRRGRSRRDDNDPSKQKTYLLLSIFALITCPLCGLAAVCYALNARESYQDGDLESGVAEANCAKMFAVAAIVTTLTALLIIAIMLSVLIHLYPSHF